MLPQAIGVAIIGDGAMGTVSAIMLAENGWSVRLWSAFPEARIQSACFMSYAA
jgi:glycerol-3-phosphate dehydrogenase